ncbi:hypothetical protein [Facilibium subflavum]|uniref:hypothetical protein n=1 Tax=Facilibium subflavum TaxID=2219058 RepID=UPI000E64EF27|nr:hypothetical protein [Facilibium subflavum]
MIKNRIILSVSGFMVLTGMTFAHPSVHTTHHIYATNDASKIKPWSVRITGIAPNEAPYFVSGDVTSSDIVLSVSKDKSAEYGFGFYQGSDFNVAYTLTAIDTSQTADASQHKTKSCTFIVGANGPANPNITVKNYQGAKCTYKDETGNGVDFYLA